jgi:Protein of unknown function (DUF1207)
MKRSIVGLGLVVWMCLRAAAARADEPTAPAAAPDAPPAAPGAPAAPATNATLVPPGSPPTPEPFSGWEFGATGETIFEHTRAGLRDPHFGMRLYRDDAVPGTLNPISNPAPGSDVQAAVPNGPHTFWDVSFGESMPVFTWFDVNPERARYARGFQFNFDAGAFMLLDFDSQSSGVIDTDFRIGGSFDFRPWWPVWEHLSLKVGFFHESTHLGDEYVLSAATIQGQSAPMANAALVYRANPSYEALPVTASIDVPFDHSHVSARVYGGTEAYFWSELPNGAFPSEWRVGAELRWTSFDGANVNIAAPSDAPVTDRIKANLLRRSTGVHRDQVTKIRADRVRKRRGAFTVEGAYELLAKRRYDHVGVEPGGATFVSADGFWYVQHATVLGLYNLDTERSSSNAVGLSLDWIRGRSPFGQLTEYTHVDTLALGVEYYW